MSGTDALERAAAPPPGVIVWFTGLSGSGKTTLARNLAARLRLQGSPVVVLDGDDLRQRLSNDLGFSPEHRSENVLRTGEIARLIAISGIPVIAALISPFQKDREALRRQVAPGRFVEVYLDVPLDVCEARDPKGLYRRARTGEEPCFTGIGSPYEPPLSPDLRLPTHLLDLDTCLDRLLGVLESPLPYLGIPMPRPPSRPPLPPCPPSVFYPGLPGALP